MYGECKLKQSVECKDAFTRKGKVGGGGEIYPKVTIDTNLIPYYLSIYMVIMNHSGVHEVILNRRVRPQKSNLNNESFQNTILRG